MKAADKKIPTDPLERALYHVERAEQELEQARVAVSTDRMIESLEGYIMGSTRCAQAGVELVKKFLRDTITRKRESTKEKKP